MSSSGCKKDGHAAAPSAAPAAEGAHAPAGVKPGSHEDWCVEHDVPESQCTRCNKELVAAFKATGDWCSSHEVPESHCVACDPSRKKVRPPKVAAP
ncbi:MAG: hypothetical protein IV100_20705 [Myxococcales bacterium]|nr:hypothetical protein [Myxococcales bacterium]